MDGRSRFIIMVGVEEVWIKEDELLLSFRIVGIDKESLLEWDLDFPFFLTCPVDPSLLCVLRDFLFFISEDNWGMGKNFLGNIIVYLWERGSGNLSRLYAR